MFRIAIRPYARVVGIAKAAFAFFASLAAAGIVVDAGREMDRIGADETLLTAAIIASVVGGVLALRVMWSNLRSAVVRKATIQVSQGSLTIAHEGIFRRPVTIDDREIKVVAFDDRPARRRGRDHSRFPLPGDGEVPPWLHSRVSGSPYPLLSQVPDVPNVAIAFERPLVLQRPRRFVKAFPSKQAFFPPLEGRPSRGLVMRVKDPQRFRSAIEDHLAVRPLVLDDLAEPGSESRARAKRIGIYGNVVLGILIVAQFALPLAVSADGPEPPGSETFSALGRVCGATRVAAEPYTPSDEGLGRLLPSPDSRAGLLFDSPIDLGDAALFSAHSEVGRWTQELLDHDFEEGYVRRWAADGRFSVAAVWEFRTQGGAADLELFARNEACPYAQDAFLVPGVDDAVGVTFQTGTGWVDQVTFLRGRYRFLVTETSIGRPAGHEGAVALARATSRGLPASAE